MSVADAPSIVTPAEWLRRTSVTLSVRSPALRRVDAVYADWHKWQRDPKRRAALRDALDAFLLENGGVWSKVGRDAASNGLMSYIHLTVSNNVFQSREAPHTRYGALFFLGSIQVELDTTQLALSAFSLGGEMLGAFGSDNLLGADHLAYDGVLVGVTGLRALGKLDAENAASHTPLSRVEVQGAARPPAAVVSSVSDDEPASEMRRSSGAKAPAQAIEPQVIGRIVETSIWDGLTSWISACLLARQQAGLVTSMEGDGTRIPRAIGGVLRTAAKTVVSACVESAAPFLKDGMQLGQGIKQTIDSAFQFGRDKALRAHKFSISPGHPASIANAIQWQLARDLADKSLGVAKSAGMLYLQGVTAGAASIVSVIVSGIEWLLRLAMKLFELLAIREFLDLARQQYRIARKHAAISAGSHAGSGRVIWEPDTSSGLIASTPAFTAFFERGCSASPVIPMLTLNSGVCGHAMTYCRMFEGDASTARVISQETFDNGSAYFSNLKLISQRYLREKGFRFVARPDLPNDTKDYVNGLLMHAVRDHSAASDRWANRADMTFLQKARWFATRGWHVL